VQWYRLQRLSVTQQASEKSCVRSRQSVTTSYEQEMQYGEFFSTDGRTYEVMTQRLMLGFGTGG